MYWIYGEPMLVTHTLKQKQKKFHIVAVPELESLDGHTLLIDKALYALQSSGLCWHQFFADVLHSMGFAPTKADADIWMQECNDPYEYIAVYVDDLFIAARDPNEMIEALSEKHKFKLKGIGSLT
jgi:Reverse transcriptase (RNA-dependent DNA polymerase)